MYLINVSFKRYYIKQLDIISKTNSEAIIEEHSLTPEMMFSVWINYYLHLFKEHYNSLKIREWYDGNFSYLCFN